MKNIITILLFFVAFSINAQTLIKENFVIAPDLTPRTEYIKYTAVAKVGSEQEADYNLDYLVNIDSVWFALGSMSLERSDSEDNWQKAENGLPEYSKNGVEITKDEFIKATTSKSYLQGMDNAEYVVNQTIKPSVIQRIHEQGFDAYKLNDGFSEITAEQYDNLKSLFDELEYEDYRAEAEKLIVKRKR